MAASRPQILRKKPKQSKKREMLEMSRTAKEVDPIDHAVNIDDRLGAFVEGLSTVAAGVSDFVDNTGAIESQIESYLSSNAVVDPAILSLLKKCRRYGPMGTALTTDVKRMQEEIKQFAISLELIRSSVFQRVTANVESDYELKAHFDAGAVRPPPKIATPSQSKKQAANPSKKTPNPALLPSQLR